MTDLGSLSDQDFGRGYGKLSATAFTLAQASGWETDEGAKEVADGWMRRHPHHRVEIDWCRAEGCWVVRTHNAAGVMRFLRIR